MIVLLGGSHLFQVNKSRVAGSSCSISSIKPVIHQRELVWRNLHVLTSIAKLEIARQLLGLTRQIIANRGRKNRNLLLKCAKMHSNTGTVVDLLIWKSKVSIQQVALHDRVRPSNNVTSLKSNIRRLATQSVTPIANDFSFQIKSVSPSNEVKDRSIGHRQQRHQALPQSNDHNMTISKLIPTTGTHSKNQLLSQAQHRKTLQSLPTNSSHSRTNAWQSKCPHLVARTA